MTKLLSIKQGCQVADVGFLLSFKCMFVHCAYIHQTAKMLKLFRTYYVTDLEKGPFYQNFYLVSTYMYMYMHAYMYMYSYSEETDLVTP